MTQVVENVPASTANLRPGDLILSAGETPTTCVEDREECVDAAPAGEALDLFPNPDFNILGILSYTSNDERRELRSPRERVREELGAGTHAFSLRGPERWHLWLGVVGVGRATETIAQEQTPN